MLKKIKIFPQYKPINNTISHSTSKRDTNRNKNILNHRISRYNIKRLNNISISPKINNKTSITIDNSKQELINTIKDFITEPTIGFYSNINNNNNNNSNITICPYHNSLSNKKSKSAIDSLHNFRNNYKINKKYYPKSYLIKKTKFNLNKNNNKNIINNSSLKNSNNNFINIDLEYEIEKRINIIEKLNLNINNMSKKINLMKYQINILNNYFNIVNKQLIKVLYNSKTIKLMQKNFDNEIPNIKEEINEIKNKIFLIRKENEIYNLNIYNIINEIEFNQEQSNQIENINNSINSEIKNIKQKIFLIQSLNTNFKNLLNKNIFY